MTLPCGWDNADAHMCVARNLRTALCITGLVTMIACYHYFRIFNSWVDAYAFQARPRPSLIPPLCMHSFPQGRDRLAECPFVWCGRTKSPTHSGRAEP